MQTARPRRHDGRNGERGLALLDVLLALSVLSLLLMVALPAVRPGTSPLRLEAYAGEVADLLKFERAAAAQSGRPAGVRIDVARRTFAASARPRTLVLPADLALDILSSDGCGGDRANITLTFDADGRSCGAVINIARGDRTWRVRINWLTGHVDVAQTS